LQVTAALIDGQLAALQPSDHQATFESTDNSGGDSGGIDLPISGFGIDKNGPRAHIANGVRWSNERERRNEHFVVLLNAGEHQGDVQRSGAVDGGDGILRARAFGDHFFEDLLGVPEAGIRELLGQLDKKALAMSLRGATEELKNLVFKSMSSRAVDMLKEDMEVLGPVRTKDVNQAQREIVEVARRLEAEGKLVLSAESQEEYVV